jgi:hypothetical protein
MIVAINWLDVQSVTKVKKQKKKQNRAICETEVPFFGGCVKRNSIVLKSVSGLSLPKTELFSPKENM